MLRFISLGSGSSGNCYFLFTDSDGLIIDSGVGIRSLKKHFRDYGLSLPSIHHIVVTHDHADHVKSVGNLSSDLHLPVYTTSKIHQGIIKNYCVSKKIPFDLQHLLQKAAPARPRWATSRSLPSAFLMTALSVSVFRSWPTTPPSASSPMQAA